MSTETMKADADDTNPYLLHNMSRCEWPPDWRFRRARDRFFDEVPRDADVDDDLIDAAVKVLKAHEYKGRRGTGLLRKSRPEILAAFDLYEQRSHKHMRNLIEAALIVATPERISEYCGIPEAVIKAYHDLFFSIQMPEPIPGWFRSYVMDPAIDAIREWHDEGAKLKLIAFGFNWDGLAFYLCPVEMHPEFKENVQKLMEAQQMKAALEQSLYMNCSDHRILPYLDQLKGHGIDSPEMWQNYEEGIASQVIHSNKFYKLTDRGVTFEDGHEPRAIDQIREREEDTDSE